MSKVIKDLKRFSNRMKKDIELYELIEKYLTGALSGEEKIAFENQISKNPELANSVEDQRLLAELIEEGTLLEIRNSIQMIHEENPGGAKGGITVGRILLISAIVFIASLILYTLFFNDTGKKNFEPPAMDHPIVDSTSTEDQKSVTEEIPVESQHELEQTEQQDEPNKNNQRETIKENNQLKSDGPVASRMEEKKDLKTEPDTLSISEVPGKEKVIDSMEKEIRDDKPVNVFQEDSINCDTVIIQADIQTEESCKERATGKMVVKVSSGRGALPPYSISIDNGRNYQYKSIINKLMPGNYIVWLKDRNNCLSEVGSYLIGSVVCDYEFIFAPDKGERWEIPTKNQSGTITIYSKQGTLVFTQRFEEGEIITWDGNSLNGNSQSMGVYRFILELDDNKPVVGNVTIVR